MVLWPASQPLLLRQAARLLRALAAAWTAPAALHNAPQCTWCFEQQLVVQICYRNQRQHT